MWLGLLLAFFSAVKLQWFISESMTVDQLIAIGQTRVFVTWYWFFAFKKITKMGSNFLMNNMMKEYWCFVIYLFLSNVIIITL